MPKKQPQLNTAPPARKPDDFDREEQAGRGKRSGKPRKSAQLELLDNQVTIDNELVINKIVNALRKREETAESVKINRKATEEYEEALSSYASELKVGESMDVLVGGEYFVRLVGREKTPRKAVPKGGVTVSKKLYRMSELGSRA